MASAEVESDALMVFRMHSSSSRKIPRHDSHVFQVLFINQEAQSGIEKRIVGEEKDRKEKEGGKGAWKREEDQDLLKCWLDWLRPTIWGYPPGGMAGNRKCVCISIW